MNTSALCCLIRFLIEPVKIGWLAPGFLEGFPLNLFNITQTVHLFLEVAAVTELLVIPLRVKNGQIDILELRQGELLIEKVKADRLEQYGLTQILHGLVYDSFMVESQLRKFRN